MKRVFILIWIISDILIPCYSTVAQNSLYKNSFPLNDVQLLEGPFQHARDLNIKTINNTGKNARAYSMMTGILFSTEIPAELIARIFRFGDNKQISSSVIKPQMINA